MVANAGRFAAEPDAAGGGGRLGADRLSPRATEMETGVGALRLRGVRSRGLCGDGFGWGF